MVNSINIRVATSVDLSAVADIARSCFDDYSADDYLKMSIDSNYEFVVAEKNGIIMGYLIYLKIDDKLEIIKIATGEDFKRQGVATSLISYMKDQGLKNHHTGIILEVNEFNVAARHLYEKIGFKQIYIRKKYYHGTDDAIIMELIF